MTDQIDSSGVAHRRLHKLTPVADTVPAMAFITLLSATVDGGAVWSVGVFGLPAGLVLLVLITAVILAYRYLYWTRFTFWFDEVGDLRIDSGVVFRNERKVALSRLQAVDVERSIVARLFGLSTVKIEVAGAGDSRVKLSYLADRDAEAMRAEILTRSKSAGAEPDVALATEESIIAAVPPGRLLAALLMRSSTAFLLLLTVFIVVNTALTQGTTGLVLLLFTGGVPLFMVFGEFLTYYGFTVARAHDGVRLRYGLLRTQAQTVPHGRVAAVDLIEPLLWRWRGWVRVRITIAGVGATGDGDAARTAQTVLLPVGPRDQAMEVLSHVLLGVAVDSVTLVSAPAKARWRAPIQGSKLAYGHDDTVFVTRRGLITRHLSAVAHARTQSVSLVQGPYQRALGLSTMRVDVAPGPVSVVGMYFPASDMAVQALDQVQRARRARVGDWASGPGGKPDEQRNGSHS